eukprot:PhM_4_TR18621/c1_g2_i1/m.27203
MTSVKEIVESTGCAFFPPQLSKGLEVDADDRSVLNDVYVTLKASASSLASHFEKQEQRPSHTPGKQLRLPWPTSAAILFHSRTTVFPAVGHRGTAKNPRPHSAGTASHDASFLRLIR